MFPWSYDTTFSQEETIQFVPEHMEAPVYSDNMKVYDCRELSERSITI